MAATEARINEALKSLGEEFRLGMVAAEEYRARRRLLLESWGERDVTTSPGSLNLLAAAAGPTPAISRTTVIPPPPKGKGPATMVGVVALVVVAAGAWFVISHRTAPSAPQPARSTAAVAPPSAEVVAVKKAADEFLARNAWDAEPIDAFLKLWAALSETDRSRALEEPSLRTLRYEIQQNLQAEAQLVSPGAPPEQRSRLDALARFARELGD